MSQKESDLITSRLHQFILGVNNANVEILWIKDSTDAEYQNSKTNLDLKFSVLNDDKLRIHYKVYEKTQKIRLWIEYESSKVHDDFYNQYRNASFRPPIVVLLVKDEDKNPGEYDVEWDGRDQTPDKRLLLAGKYKVKIKGKCNLGEKESETTLQIGKPRSFNYGIHYYKKDGLTSSKKDVHYTASKQQKLSDGTGFDTSECYANTADAALTDFQAASVVYFSGHSNPNGIAFHASEGKKYIKAHSTFLHSLGGTPSLEALSKNALKDLFLIMLNGCNTGNEVLMVQFALILLDPGPIDDIHGPRTTKAIAKFQQFNDIKPADGTKNEATLKRLGISSEGKDEKRLTREVQIKLKSYYPGKADGVLGNETRKALRNYQQDHLDLYVTGEPDEPTLKALKLRETRGFSSVNDCKNIAFGAISKGADIAIGFTHTVDWYASEDWGIAFWDNLANGDGVSKAANDATALVDHRKRIKLRFNIYTQDGISKESTIHPARYGKAS